MRDTNAPSLRVALVIVLDGWGGLEEHVKVSSEIPHPSGFVAPHKSTRTQPAYRMRRLRNRLCEMTALTVHGERGRTLLIEVHGFEREAAEHPDDANWLRCSAKVEQGAFRGAVEASFTTHDFARFLAEMDRLMSGETLAATFSTMEQALELRIKVDRAGRATVVGTLREAHSFGVELSFHFESDLSFLTTTHTELQAVVAAFPHRLARE